MLIIFAAVISYLQNSGWYLVLRDGKTNEIYDMYPVSNGDEFGISFIHSVNKSMVKDIYEIKDNKIYVEKTIYYAFGAGVQTEILDGQTLEFGPDNEMIVSGFDLEMPNLSYIVGTVSDHILEINDDEISLRELCGRNSAVKFSCEYIIFGVSLSDI